MTIANGKDMAAVLLPLQAAAGERDRAGASFGSADAQ